MVTLGLNHGTSSVTGVDQVACCLSNGGCKAVGQLICADTHHCPSDLPFLFAFLNRTSVCGEQYSCHSYLSWRCRHSVRSHYSVKCWLFCVLFCQQWQRFYWFGSDLFFICIWITNQGKLQCFEELKPLLSSSHTILA